MKKLKDFIVNLARNIWAGTLSVLIKNSETAVKVTDIVKAVIDNPALNFVVELTPTKTDDMILAKAKKLVPMIGMRVALAFNIAEVAKSTDDELEKLTLILDLVRNQFNEDGKGAFYREFSGMLIEALSDGKISLAESLALGQFAFKKFFSKD
jgi:hypothetical protein